MYEDMVLTTVTMKFTVLMKVNCFSVSSVDFQWITQSYIANFADKRRSLGQSE
jgi:hypothetical protein